MRLIVFIAALLLSFPAQAEDGRAAPAITSGAAFEDDISALLRAHGFTVEMHSGYGGTRTELKTPKDGTRMALRQPPYTTLYGSPGRYDFVLLAKELPTPVWIETKYQKVGGSIDEKAPYVFLNALSAVPGRHVVILIGGAGWREGAQSWIRAAGDDRRFRDMANYPDKRVDIMNPDEFAAWLDRTLAR